MRIILITLAILSIGYSGISQEVKKSLFYAGYAKYKAVDSSRIYKPQSDKTDPLHYRPILFEIWYPSENKSTDIVRFGELMGMYQESAIYYQEKDYTGLTKELAEQLIAGSGAENIDVDQLLNKETQSYKNIQPIHKRCSVVIYMAGQNGAAFENYPIFEHLAGEGYIVMSISSVGLYPGYMSNSKEDLMEQVYDAEFGMKMLSEDDKIRADTADPGVIGYSWGGLGAVVFGTRHSNVRTILSMDGTETYYFGNSDEEDEKLSSIQRDILQFEPVRSSYFYIESGDKADSFTPTGKYDYYERLKGKKWYLRFTASAHEDFSCLPSVLNPSSESAEQYKALVLMIGDYFNQQITSVHSDSLTKYFAHPEDISTDPLSVISDTSAIISLDGNVIDKRTGEGVPYASIGIPNKNMGTVGNESGVFSLNIRSHYSGDSIRISSIGYHTIAIPVKRLLKERLIYLEPNEEALQGIVIEGKALKKKVIGNKTESKFISTPFGYKQLGAEMGVKIQVKNGPVYVDAFNFNIPFNKLNNEAIFRLNIYQIRNNKPFNNILKENILIPIEPGQIGRITTSLKQYHIVLRNDVIVSLEWVGYEGDLKPGEGVNFSLGLFNHGTYVRYASQSEMEKKFGLGVGFNLDIRY